ncbi:hypothetical protein [Rhodospirillaceae bacterium SYSU D60014]|jgi:hypothetical protein|uniref:hypothetical protein n=1 Tax=Virgifigura deserti TaxID=2268457 RepID=UPI000E66EC27
MTTEHKFKAGQTVMSVKSTNSLIPLGRYQIVRPLPTDGVSNQYRIKSVLDGHERVVRESDLTQR